MGRPERRLDPAEDPLHAFAYELRKLRREAGSPTYRVLAKRAGYSASVLSVAATGDALPTLPVLLAYVGACGGDPADWEQRWRDLEAALATGRPTGGPAPPQQLPPPDPHFVGRSIELTMLYELLDRSSGARPAVAFAAICGMPGVGKSALAVHFAHGVTDRYPDGQLYLNLHGFAATRRPTRPTEALRTLLTGLRIPPARIPAALDAQVALYRSVLAGRRMLLVLDNAVDDEQVRPLLPAVPGSLVLVTSRSTLTGLVAREGALPVALGLPSPAEARDLLVRRLAGSRPTDEPGAVDEIVVRCGRLPLALAVVAARAATRPAVPLAAMTAELRAGRALEALDTGDVATDVRAVFAWSYHRLTAPAARLFRTLAAHPGVDATVPAAASLVGASPHATHRALDELAKAHLVVERAAGRYAMHDLLRVYAADMAEQTDPPDDRYTARVRLAEHHLHTGYRAALLIHPNRDPVPLGAPMPGVVAADLPDDDAALAWFAAEYPAMVTTVEWAAGAGLDALAWRLAWTLGDFLSGQGHWQAWVAVQETALTSARRIADRLGEAVACRALATAYGRLGRYAVALPHLDTALEAYRDLADPIGQAHTHYQFAWLYGRQGEHDHAVRHAHDALRLFRTGSHRYGRAISLNQIGWSYANLGDHQRAIIWCRRAVTAFRALGDTHHEAAAWDSVGYAHHHLGRHDRAVDCYQRALALTRSSGDQYGEFQILDHLGDAHHALGDLPSARDAWQHALTILGRLDGAANEPVLAKLHRLDSAG